ncbi:1-phosphofructokinase [Stutzerimonas tarimensis]|uniref:Phosphofructokinase n=1 Tax=Stutzerimonas tarimensis TaxID=1507735 RepID=A0ABV7TB61_9GAMM
MARILTLTLNPALDLTLRLPALRLGEVNRSEALNLQAAGKGLNVAQVLGDLGHQLTVSGFLGGANPQAFEALFAARHFIDRFIRVPGQTRSNIKLAEAGGRVTDVNGPGLQIPATARDRLLEELPGLLTGQDAVVVAGSLPQGFGLVDFAELLARIKASGVPLVLDTSGAALREGLRAQPWLAKPNETELAEIGSGGPWMEQARALQAAGVTHLVVSRGAEGVAWFAPDGLWQATPPPVPVVSTVGAGDSLVAGLLHGLLEGWPAERTLRQATAIAAQAVGQIAFGITDPDALRQLQSQVRIEAPAQNK